MGLNRIEVGVKDEFRDALGEKILKNAELAIDREEIKRRLPVKIMHQTLNVILKYLEDKGLIVDSHKGVLWIYNPSQKLRKAIERGTEI